MALVLLALLAVPMGLRLRPRRFGAVFARSAIHGAAMLIYFGALAFLPVAQVAAGLFTAPIFVLLIQRFAYGQPISGAQVLAVAVGFAGVVMVLGPEAMSGATLAGASARDRGRAVRHGQHRDPASGARAKAPRRWLPGSSPCWG